MPPKQLNKRDLIAERQRIDRAMEQIEAAKSKARAQRQEYQKYLQWKVKMQRKEREQREIEEQKIRERVDEKLRELLQEHRQQRRDETAQYKQFMHSAPKPRKPLRIADSYTRETEYLSAVEGEKERKKEEWERHRKAAIPHTAPSLRQPRTAESLRSPQRQHAQQQQLQQQAQQQQQQQAEQPDSPQTPLRVPPAATAAQIGAIADRIMEESKETGSLNMDSVASFLHLNSNQPPPTVDPLANYLVTEKKRQEQRAAASSNRGVKVGDMFETARTRRLYALNRMAADPPADYLIGTDLLRYIPTGVLDAASHRTTAGGSRGLEGLGGEGATATATSGNIDTVDGSGKAFFMTETGEKIAQQQRRQYDDDGGMGADVTAQRTMDAGNTSASSASAMDSSKRLKWKKFDPQAWMGLHPNPPIKVVERREPEEESATYEWYRTYHQKYTKVKKRTELLGANYNWENKTKHVLPPLGSIKFDEQ